MSELAFVTFNLSRPLSPTGPGRRIASIAVGGVVVFEHRGSVQDKPSPYSTTLDTMVAHHLSRYLCDRYGRYQPPVDNYVKIPNCHTFVAAAKSWMDPTTSDPDIDGAHTYGLRLHSDEVNWVDLDEAARLPGGEALGISYPKSSEDGTLLIAHSMLTLEESGMHTSVAGSGGKPYIKSTAAVLEANQEVRPGSRLVHMQARPHQIGTNAWEAYAPRDFSLGPRDIIDVRATYAAL